MEHSIAHLGIMETVDIIEECTPAVMPHNLSHCLQEHHHNIMEYTGLKYIPDDQSPDVFTDDFAIVDATRYMAYILKHGR